MKSQKTEKNSKYLNKVVMLSKPSAKNTLLSIPIGESVLIKSKLIKHSSVRSAISILNSEGYQFVGTEKGLVDEMKVTRIK